ncbi:HAD-IIB family hydrolase [Chitinophaga sp. Cy-1792]|uniref:HAD-IIB family hydrolase n=1 Tax=Chitinophaga sp. Cy-1792 TaxID=2608339 RepID=UPI00141DD5CF|nr:HAD-IIB family hydrolase [Chitinophaga sp. Cy-1792]NIG54470.1 HAD-IIB family hydrolase [Chitinophaga sp. Cy-1792]
MKKLIVFDLDGTIAESKSAIDAEMATLLNSLMGIMRVAIISGGNWQQFETQVLGNLPQSENWKNLSLLPTSGTRFYSMQDLKTGWQQLYAEDFTREEKSRIIAAIQAAVVTTGYTVGQTWGEQIEDRGSQITWSALGQQAPLEAKRTWDPDSAKRKQIQAILDKSLEGFSVNIGGTTSIDVTRQGIDKAYGIRKLQDILHIAIADMIFVGDAIYPGGNDYPAKQAGALSIAVRDIHETKRVIETVLACLG